MSVLSLAEELLLLGYDSKGRPVVERNRLDHGLAGAVLSELVLADRVDVGERHVAVVSGDPTGDPLADDALQRVAADPAAHRPPGWLSRLRVGLRDRVLARLVEHAVLRRDKGRILGLFGRTAYPTVNPQPEVDLRRRLTDVVDRQQPAPARTVALVSLAAACDMEAQLASRADRDRVRTRMEEVASGEPVGSAVRTAIDAVDDAIMASAGRHPRSKR